MPIVSCFCLKICFRLVASVLFFFISRSPFLCAWSTSNIGSVSHPAGDRPSHPICETVPAPPVDATPYAINLFTKGGVHDATETGKAFRDRAERHVEPLEGWAVLA